jgi:hypothetical protein
MPEPPPVGALCAIAACGAASARAISDITIYFFISLSRLFECTATEYKELCARIVATSEMVFS